MKGDAMRTFLAGWLRRQADRLDPPAPTWLEQQQAMIAQLQEICRLLREWDRPSRAEVRDHVRAAR